MDREGRGVAEARVRSREERRALRDEARPEQLARGRALRTGLGGSANSFLFFGFDNLRSNLIKFSFSCYGLESPVLVGCIKIDLLRVHQARAVELARGRALRARGSG